MQKGDKGTAFGRAERYGQPGEPALPVFRAAFLLPPDANLGSVDVRLKNVTEECISVDAEIDPVLPYYTFDRDGRVILSRYGPPKDLSVYSKDAFFPAEHLRIVQTGQLRGYKLVEIYVQTQRYNPVTKHLEALTGATVVIDYAADDPQTRFAEPFGAHRLVRSLAVNYGDMAGRYASPMGPDQTTGYVIITTESIASSSAELDGFASIKEADGFDVQLLTEDDWGGGTGEAAAEAIRDWLASNYQAQGIEFALMVGDPSSDSEVPMVYGPTASSDAPLTDYWYADLTGDSGGMGGFDKYAEIHVGRLPVYGNTSDLDAILSRLTDYMKEEAASAEAWRFSAYLPLHTFGDAQAGYPFGEEVKSRILDPASWGVFRLYDTGIHIGEAQGIDYDSVTQHWNDNRFSLMTWQAHGLATMAQEVMTTEQSAQLRDDYPCHGFQISCHNGCPDNPSNLGFAIVKHAAVSTVASAVQIWYNQSTTNYGSAAAGNDFAFVYMKNLVDELPAGAAMNAARAALPISSANDWQNCVELNLYGCPAIGPYTYGVEGGDADSDADSDTDADADSDTDGDTDSDSDSDGDDDDDNDDNDNDDNDDNNDNDDIDTGGDDDDESDDDNSDSEDSVDSGSGCTCRLFVHGRTRRFAPTTIFLAVTDTLRTLLN